MEVHDEVMPTNNNLPYIEEVQLKLPVTRSNKNPPKLMDFYCAIMEKSEISIMLETERYIPREEMGFVFENSERGVKFEVPDFDIPDLTIPEGRVGVEKSIEIKVSNTLIPNLEMNIGIVRYRNDGVGSVLLGLDIYAWDPDKKSKVFRFKDSLYYKPEKYGEETDGTPHKFWHGNHRMVDPAYRGQGLSEFAMSFKEELFKKIAEKYPELKAEWIDVTTDIAAVGKLVIDQTWLKEHGLDKYAKKHGHDLGYIPHPHDESLVEELLQSGSSGLGDISHHNDRPVMFIKRL